MKTIIRHFRSCFQAEEFRDKAAKVSGVTYAKKYQIGSGHYACMIVSNVDFPEDIYKALLGRGRNFAEERERINCKD